MKPSSNICLGVNSKIQKWIEFHKEFRNKQQSQNQIQKCICLMGSLNTGRSTLCELIKAGVAKDKNQNLKLQTKNNVKFFTLPGVIDAQLNQAQTTKPIIYKIQSKVNDAPSDIIIDVPTSALAQSLQFSKNSKSIFQSRTAACYLLKSISSGRFVLAINQSITRSLTDTLKGMFYSFVHLFGEPSQQFLNSTAFVITRCSPDIKIEKIHLKMQGFLKIIKNDNISKWYNVLKQKNAIFLMKRVNTEEQSIDEAEKLYKDIQEKLDLYNVDNEKIEILDKNNPEMKNQINNYLNSFSKGLKGLFEIVIDITKEFIEKKQVFQNKKDAIILKEFGFEIKVKNQISNLPSSWMILKFCCKVQKILKNPYIENKKLFDEIIQQLTNYQILSKEQDLYFLLRQRANFYDTFFGVDKIKQFQYLFVPFEILKDIKKNQKIIQIIKQKFKEGQSIQFYENYLQIIEYISSQTKCTDLTNVWIKSKLEIIGHKKQSSAPEALLDIVDICQDVTEQTLGVLFVKIAQILQKLDQIGLSLEYIGKSGNPAKVINFMNSLLLEKQQMKRKYRIQSFLPYLKFLQQYGLYEKSYETCYVLGDLFEDQDVQERQKLRPFFLNTRQQISEVAIDCFLKKKVSSLNKQQLNILRQIAQQNRKK